MSKKRWKRQKYTTDGSDSISFQFSTGDVWRVRGGNKTFQTDCLLLLPPRPSRTTFHLQIYSLTLMAITAKASRQTGQFQQNAIDSPLLYLFLVAPTKVSKTKLVLNRKSSRDDDDFLPNEEEKQLFAYRKNLVVVGQKKRGEKRLVVGGVQ